MNEYSRTELLIGEEGMGDLSRRLSWYLVSAA